MPFFKSRSCPVTLRAVLKLFRNFIAPVLALLIPIGASAGRKVYTYPMRVSSDWVTGSACYLVGTTTLSLKNISNQTQSISVKVTNASVSFGTCGGVSLPGPFVGSTPGCYNTSTSFSSAYTQSITMAPLASADVDLSVYCDVTVNAGIVCTQTSRPLQITATVSSTGVQYSYRFEVQVDVSNDQGALIGAIYSKPGIGCAGGSSTAFNFPLNGGRPF
jgi:hypothetical protein